MNVAVGTISGAPPAAVIKTSAGRPARSSRSKRFEKRCDDPVVVNTLDKEIPIGNEVALLRPHPERSLKREPLVGLSSTKVI